MKQNIFLAILLLIGFNLSGQSPYSEIDAFARTNKFSTKSIETLTLELTEPYETDEEKVRAIYIWITDNIAYDFERLKKRDSKKSRSDNKIKYQTEAEYHQIVKERKRKMATATLKSKKGICQDYSTLFTEMCDVIGVESKIIPGYGKTDRNKIGKVPRPTGHAWNSVHIKDTWYLMDLTWASGGSQGGNYKYQKKFKEGFFLVDPNSFIKNHFPQESEHQYLDQPITAEEFSQIPFIGFGYYKYKISDYSPSTALVKPASDLTFTFTSDRAIPLNNIGVFVGKNKIPAEVDQVGEEYIIKLTSFKKKSGNLSILIREGPKQSSELLVYKLKG